MTETRAIDARRSGDAVDVTAEAPAQRTRRRALLIILSTILALALVGAGYLYWEHTSHFESTDDAFIDARQFPSEANVAQSAAALRFAQQEAERSQTLVQRGTGTVQRQQQASSTLQQEQARRKSAVDGVEAT
jgi:membrane fusion protein (multidrug efflux system)